MVGGKMLMLMFILASGYLFAVYILLAIAKHSSKRTVNSDIRSMNGVQGQSDISVTQQVSEVINNPESLLNIQ